MQPTRTTIDIHQHFRCSRPRIRHHTTFNILHIIRSIRSKLQPWKYLWSLQMHELTIDKFHQQMTFVWIR